MIIGNRNTFRKEERLCSKKLIDGLFASGHGLTVYPYRVQWQLCPAEVLPEGVRMQVLITTSKRRFHHAVDRNRVKRLTRECYRKEKRRLAEWLDSHGLSVVLSLNYIHTEIMDYARLSHKMEKVTDTLIHEIEKWENC